MNFCFGFESLPLLFGWRSREDELAAHFRAIIPEFRRKYYLNKSPRETDEVTVAVHVRRGDALPDNPGYFTRNENILRTVISVKSIIDIHKVKYRLCVYSQGNRADFQELALPGTEFFLDVDAVWAMQELIEADVLIMAKGYFSYHAGLISDGIKIFEPSPYMPTVDDWLLCSQDGSFDCAAFEHQLFLLLQRKVPTNRLGIP